MNSFTNYSFQFLSSNNAFFIYLFIIMEIMLTHISYTSYIIGRSIEVRITGETSSCTKLSRSRIHERTISLKFLGIILRVFRLEVSVYNIYFQTTFAQVGGGGGGRKIH